MLQKKSLFAQIVFFRYMLVIAGILITAYLIYVNNFSDSILSCGSIGDCNKVQNSSYGFLLGIPVTFFGFFFFVFFALLYSHYFIKSKFISSQLVERVGLSFSLSGFMFSVYLTYIELFVIKEVCIWCISLAMLVTILFITNICASISVKKTFKMIRSNYNKDYR